MNTPVLDITSIEAKNSISTTVAAGHRLSAMDDAGRTAAPWVVRTEVGRINSSGGADDTT